MIEVRPKFQPELQGCKSFGFHSKNNLKEDRKQQYYTSDEQASQNKVIAAIRASLERLRAFPCEVQITIGAQNGKSIATGEISAYDQRSMDAAIDILAEADTLCHRFSRMFPNSGVSFICTQTVDITRVDR